MAFDQTHVKEFINELTYAENYRIEKDSMGELEVPKKPYTAHKRNVLSIISPLVA